MRQERPRRLHHGIYILLSDSVVSVALLNPIDRDRQLEHGILPLREEWRLKRCHFVWSSGGPFQISDRRRASSPHDEGKNEKRAQHQSENAEQAREIDPRCHHLSPVVGFGALALLLLPFSAVRPLDRMIR
jgi:hypothetical protein